MAYDGVKALFTGGVFLKMTRLHGWACICGFDANDIAEGLPDFGSTCGCMEGLRLGESENTLGFLMFLMASYHPKDVKRIQKSTFR